MAVLGGESILLSYLDILGGLTILIDLFTKGYDVGSTWGLFASCFIFATSLVLAARLTAQQATWWSLVPYLGPLDIEDAPIRLSVSRNGEGSSSILCCRNFLLG